MKKTNKIKRVASSMALASKIWTALVIVGVNMLFFNVFKTIAMYNHKILDKAKIRLMETEN
ncbi:hypothetical protein GF361_00515 [Candidatus Woesearchaeota archaeon]|nr:hypothetical protein [Candidatus Woesearchaeota archaeon]